MSLNLHDSEFLLSAVKQDQYPNHPFPEVALVGRSNVGKSSLINAVINRRNLARTSGQPGRTQTINFYRLDKLCVVDLPGYGYAKVSHSVQEQWRPMIEQYLLNRENLKGIIQIVDIRHEPTNLDQTMARFLQELAVPTWVVATKADKLGRGNQKSSAARCAEILGYPVIIFSATSKLGTEEVIEVFNSLSESTD